MVDLWFFNAENIDRGNLNFLLNFLPDQHIKEIIRLSKHEDRRLKLFGKLMVKKYYDDRGIEFDWLRWRLSSSGKPYYSEEEKFNISHSGDHVVAAFSRMELGVDIERTTNFDVGALLSYFHPSEADYIAKSSCPESTFFKIWTRKEAYLKAIGKGIIDGLDNENCLKDELTREEKWYLHSLVVIPDYQIALCTKIDNCKINIRELFLSDFKN